MQSQNKYIGDDKMQKMLDHYHCEMPLEAVKMRFAGAVCSPNMELRPTDVISSLWPENREPRLQTKEEAELFFKFFMGLWDEIFEQVRHNEVRLPPYLPETSREYWRELCRRRSEQLEQGYVEGFWGGRSDLKISAGFAFRSCRALSHACRPAGKGNKHRKSDCRGQKYRQNGQPGDFLYY